MGKILEITQIFLFSLSLGPNFFTVLVNVQESGSGLLKVFNVISLISSIFLLLSFYFSELVSYKLFWFSLALAVTLVTIFDLVISGRRAQNPIIFWTKKNLFIKSMVYLFLIVFFSTKLSFNLHEMYYLTSTILYIGSVLFLMILGHWYLVTPKMKLGPLYKGMYFVWFIGGLKFVLSLISVYFWYKNVYSLRMSEYVPGHSFDMICVVSRFMFGYICLLSVSYFAFRLSKMKDTQGATGIYYVMAIFLLLGELFSIYAYKKLEVML